MKTRSMPECEPSRRGSAAARWRPPGRGRPRRSSSWPRLRGPARRICQKPGVHTQQELIDLVLAEGEKAGVKPKDEEELQKTLPELKLQMKALIARDIWDMSEYFAVMYEENPFVKKALELLEQ